jgi:hypothetical protein
MWKIFGMEYVQQYSSMKQHADMLEVLKANTARNM